MSDKQQETKAFSTPVLASITTGVLLEAPFSKMHGAAEFLMGHPIWTHEFANKELSERMRDALIKQHPCLDIDASGVDASNVHEFADRLRAELGAELTIVKGSGSRDRSPLETAREMLGATQ